MMQNYQVILSDQSNWVLDDGVSVKSSPKSEILWSLEWVFFPLDSQS